MAACPQAAQFAAVAAAATLAAAIASPTLPLNFSMASIGARRDVELLTAATVVASYANDADADAVQPERTFWWETRALHFNEKKWRRCFRVSKDVFNFVLDKIVSHDGFRVAKNITRPVPVEKQLAVFLYRVGKVHPGVAAIADKFELSSSTVVACTERVARAIIERLSYIVNFPKDGAQKQKMMKGFERSGYKGGVVTIDCTGIRIVAPTAVTRAGQKHVFVGKEKFVCKRYQVACDSTLRIRHVFGGNAGSVHDMDIFTASPLYTKIREFLRSKEYYIGDTGYALRPYMITPFKNSEIAKVTLQHVKDARTYFNRHLSAVRIMIERCFGVLKARFRCLLFGMWFRDESMYSSIFLACCVLHNICLHFRDAISEAEVSRARVVIRREKKAVRAAAKRKVKLSKIGGTLEAGRARRKRVMEEATGSCEG